MKVSLRWFQEFFDLKFKISEIEEQCLLKGIEIENVTEKKSILNNCFTGKITPTNHLLLLLY